ncbi:MAG: hypothetical protein LBJ16_03760 [Holosporaceae bacterium]|nr:hypothetical protein [Holosporaceae bacterium]
MRSFGNFCVASVLGLWCTTCTLRSCAPYAPINSSKYLCFGRSLIYQKNIPKARYLVKKPASAETGFPIDDRRYSSISEILKNSRTMTRSLPPVTQRLFVFRVPVFPILFQQIHKPFG